MTKESQGLAELGVLGTGRMGTRVAAMFARAGRRVVLGSRDPDRAAEIVDELRIPGLAAGCYSDALAAPAILPAIFIRDGLFDILDRSCRKLGGKVLIDISNPFNADYSDFVTPWNSAEPRSFSAVSRKRGWWARSRTSFGKCSTIRSSARA